MTLNQKTPPQMIILAIIAKSKNGLTIKDIASYLSYLHKHGIDTGYQVNGKNGYGVGVSKEILLDVNMLKLMNLVKEENGKLIASDKAYMVLKKYAECDSIIGSILNKL